MQNNNIENTSECLEPIEEQTKEEKKKPKTLAEAMETIFPSCPAIEVSKNGTLDDVLSALELSDEEKQKFMKFN